MHCMQVCNIHEPQRTIEEHLGEPYNNRKYYYSSKGNSYMPHQYTYHEADIRGSSGF